MTVPAFTESLTLDADSGEHTNPVLSPPTKAERVSAMELAATPLAFEPQTVPVRALNWWQRPLVRLLTALGGTAVASPERPVDAELAWAERRVLAAAEATVDAGLRHEQQITPASKRAYWAACMELEFAVNARRGVMRRLG